jgi:hypothetical protein
LYSAKSLNAHMVASHRYRAPARYCVAANVCPVCLKTFENRFFTIIHLDRTACAEAIPDLPRMTDRDCEELDLKDRSHRAASRAAGVCKHRRSR